MKKLLLGLSLVLALTATVACESEDTHTHTYKNSWSYDEWGHWKECADESCTEQKARAEHAWVELSNDRQGSVLYGCSVCDAEREGHECVFNTEWTSNTTYHWHSCTYEKCAEISGRAEHTWDEGTVITPPTSVAEGTMQYVCTECGASRREPIAMLPAKMSREAWETAFDIENVRIDTVATVGGFGTTKQTCYVDGKQMLLIEEGSEPMYSDNSALEAFDFSGYYDSFVHIGDDVYTAESVSFYMQGMYYNYKDCTVAFKGGKLSRIDFKIDMGGFFGIITDSYVFSEWGEVALEPPVLQAEDLEAALQVSRFEQDFSLYKTVWNADGSMSSTDVTVIDDIYTYSVTDLYGQAIDSGYASAEGYAASLVAEMRAIIDLMDVSQFQFDSFSGFVSTQKVQNYNGQGIHIVSVTVELSGQYLICFEYALSDGSSVSYTFSGYEDMPTDPIL
ncbi:MAG: hypothetical protein IJW16_00700 [Clostridia bacterium]|nr:hypothetical protein [Clostridia bacterium]